MGVGGEGEERGKRGWGEETVEGKREEGEWKKENIANRRKEKEEGGRGGGGVGIAGAGAGGR